MKKYLSVILCLVAFYACSEEDARQPLSGSRGKPAPVTEAKARPIPGGAIISYKIPDTDDLLAVKAVYTLSNGKQGEVMASYFVDTLKLEGLADTLQHTATLYAVSRSQVLSDPETVTFKPLESSLSMTMKTVRITADFGGALFQWKNDDRALLNFDLLAENDRGEMVVTNVLQNRLDSMEYSVRGFAPEPRKFAINISDQWGNQSGYIYPEGEYLTPIYEEKLDKSKMQFLHLLGDSDYGGWGGMDLFMLDDDLSTFGHSSWLDGWPAYTTIDLGKKAFLSRIVVHQRMYGSMYYNNANWKKFKVYKSLPETPAYNPLGEWQEIMACEIEKPSGMPIDECTSEDLRQAKKGHDFSFPRNMEAVRYVRIAATESWLGGAAPFGFLSEITFYGSYAE
ncbi:MAG: DUF4959 domain-containing protein [Bacteroidales bacterium]|nr:DUF4959 domain-containing protein [Bacteroidales bacterium]